MNSGQVLAKARLLTSRDAARVLQLALTGDPWAELPGFVARLDELHYRPGTEVSAIYTVTFSSAVGQSLAEHLVATSAEVDGRVVAVGRGADAVRVWRHPEDPRLPGLVRANDPDTVARWLADVDGAARTVPVIETVSYRPLRSATLRSTDGDATYDLHVVPIGQDDRQAERRALLATAGLTAPVLSRPTPGVLLSRAVTGPSAIRVADESASGSWPTIAGVIDLLDRLPRAVSDLPWRRSVTACLDEHVEAAVQHAPSMGWRIDRLAATLARTLDDSVCGPIVPTLGDCTPANLVFDGRAVQVVDVDRIGPGLREDDLAALLAHVMVAADSGRADPAAPVAAWQRECERRVDPGDLRARTAVTLLSLLPSVPSTRLEALLAQAEHLVG